MKHEEMIEEDLNIHVGIGATLSVGSDSYPYYVSETLPNGAIGMYHASSHWDDAHPWEGGSQVVDPFDARHATDFYIKRRYGHWWKINKDGSPIERFTGKYTRLSFGHAYSYCDPSF